MKRAENYVESLPEGYREAMVLDASRGRFGVIMNLVALIPLLIVVGITYLAVRPVSIEDFSQDFGFRYLWFVLSMLLYVVVHELLHGAAYKILTGRKLTFGLTLTVAYCGVPDIYVSRRTALISLLTPFTLCIPVFLIPLLAVPGAADKLCLSFLLGLHIGGCSGDLYGTFLLLFRFRDPDTWLRDTGPKQSFYVKDGGYEHD